MVVAKVAKSSRPHLESTSVLEKIRKIKNDRTLSLLDKAEALREIPVNHLSEYAKRELNQFFAEHQNAVRHQRNWCELGFPQEALLSAPDCVEQLLASHMAYSIALFNDSITLDADKHPRILMNGSLTRWEEVQSLVTFDRVKECFVSKEDPALLWTYISPQGLVQKDPYPKKLYPVKQLLPQEQKELIQHANTFWKSHPEVDPEKLKPCVLQIFTTRIDCILRNWFTEHFLDLVPRHVGIRLIDSEGRLYSFGFQINEQFRKVASCSNMLATGLAKVVTPDYAETAVFDRRFVTSIPLSTMRLERIIDFASRVNQGPGERFCQLQPNCLTFAKNVAALAGVEINCRMTVSEMILTAIPGARKVYEAVLPVFNLFSLVRAACINLVMVCLLGAAKVVEPKAGSPLIATLADLFSDEKQQLDHVYKLIQWQKEHAQATKSYYYHLKPQMHIV